MAVPAARPKIPCGYVSDSGVTYIYEHCQDIITAGSFDPDADGFPSPGKRALRPRHIGLRSGDAVPRRFKIPIATADALNALILGDDFTYGGVGCTITSKIGERAIV